MPSLLGAEDVVYIENVIAVFIVEAIILCALAWLREHSAGIARRLIFEVWIAYAIS